MRQMSDVERGWVAGVIEGEGNVGNRRGIRGKEYFDSIWVVNTDPEIISALLRLTGTGKVYEMSNRRYGWQPAFMWYLGLADSVRLARQIADCSPKCQKFLVAFSNYIPRRKRWGKPVISVQGQGYLL